MTKRPRNPSAITRQPGPASTVDDSPATVVPNLSGTRDADASSPQQAAAPVSAAEVSGSLDPAEIEREAYLIWLERGGNEVLNWLEAERRVRTRFRAPREQRST